MNPDDDHTAPASSAPTFVTADAIHPLSYAAITAPKNGMSGLLPALKRPLPPDHPEVAAGVQDLESLFAESLTDTEVSFHKAQMLAPARAAVQSSPPRNFLQAHLVIIDTLLMDPTITTTALAAATGYSRNWLHKVMSSDAFQAKLAERQKAIIDPIIMSSIKDRIQGLASRSLEILEERMESDEVSLDNAMAVFGIAGKALGLGQQKNAPVVAQQFIVHVPPRMNSATDWASLHSGRPAEALTEPLTIEPASLAEQSPPPLSEHLNTDEKAAIYSLMGQPSGASND